MLRWGNRAVYTGIQGKRTLFDLSKMCAFEPLVIAVSQENAHSLRGISRFLSDSVGP